MNVDDDMHDDYDYDYQGEDIREAITAIGKEKSGVIVSAMASICVVSWIWGGSISTEIEVLSAAVLLGSLLIYSQLCDLRIDGLQRELRALPPRGSQLHARGVPMRNALRRD